jgi:hypothetical protein
VLHDAGLVSRSAGTAGGASTRPGASTWAPLRAVLEDLWRDRLEDLRALAEAEERGADA